MKKWVCRTCIVLGIIVLVASDLLAQSDGLLSWTPSNGESSFGPYVSPIGNMNMWQDGQCINTLNLDASVVIEWACNPSSSPRVTGGASLSYCSDECIGSYPCGVWAQGKAELMIGGSWNDVDMEYADSDCSGFHDQSGGPHYWACGTGCGIAGCS